AARAPAARNRRGPADDPEPGPVRLPDSAPVHRRRGGATAVVALLLYALLPILRNTYTGIRPVDPPRGGTAPPLGMPDGQRLPLVELPLALPVILAGVRIATVVSVGTATIAAAIGAGGLGTYVFRGIATVDTRLILAGAIPAAALAL